MRISSFARGTALAISFWTLLINGNAQDIHLSQFSNTPLLRNPALAGIFTGDTRFQAVYRNQWQSIGYPYQTAALSGEYKFAVGDNDDFITTGLSCFYDVAGIMRLKTLQLMPALNYHKSLSQNKSSYLSAGFMAGIVQRQFDGKYLTFDNQYNNGRYNPAAFSGESFTGMRRSFADFAAGLSYNSSIGEATNYYLGASLWHFNKPKANFLSDQRIQLDPKWQFNAGVRASLSDLISLQAEANHLMQANYRETVGGAILFYSLNDQLGSDSRISNASIGAGLFMRVNDALIPQVQLSYNHFDIGLSYDINISDLKVASRGRGGYELSLSYRAFTRSNTISYMRCPRF
jgi:type IX secretion system PorP/SprF family membrane protein